MLRQGLSASARESFVSFRQSQWDRPSQAPAEQPFDWLIVLVGFGTRLVLAVGLTVMSFFLALATDACDSNGPWVCRGRNMNALIVGHGAVQLAGLVAGTLASFGIGRHRRQIQIWVQSAFGIAAVLAFGATYMVGVSALS